MTATFPPAASSRRRSYTSVLFGLFLTVAGVLFVLSNFELLSFQPTLLDLTPILLGIVAADRFFAGRPAAAGFWVLAAAVLTYALLEPNFDLGRIVRLWPVAVLGAGVVTVLRALGVGRSVESPTGQGELAFFSTLKNRSIDPAYAGGSCLSVLGSHKLDLRAAQLDENGAVLQIFVMWGGIDITVPESWSVSTQVFAALGGAADKTRPPGSLPAGLPRLVVRGVVVMGGLEVHN